MESVGLYSKTCLNRPCKKKTKNGFQYWLSLHAGQKYCRMLQGEHSAILLTFIKLPFVIKIFVLSIFEWPFKTGLTVSFFSVRYSDVSFSQTHGICWLVSFSSIKYSEVSFSWPQKNLGKTTPLKMTIVSNYKVKIFHRSEMISVIPSCTNCQTDPLQWIWLS